jgi:hypothetical protein
MPTTKAWFLSIRIKGENNSKQEDQNEAEIP